YVTAARVERFDRPRVGQAGLLGRSGCRARQWNWLSNTECGKLNASHRARSFEGAAAMGKSGGPRSKVGRVPEEIPTIRELKGSAEVARQIVHQPRLAALKRRDGVDLPATLKRRDGVDLPAFS